MKKEKLKHIAKRITALAAAAAMAATFTFPAEIGDGFFEGFGNAIVASAVYSYTGEALDISNGSIEITGATEFKYGGSFYTYFAGDEITVKGTTYANTITVAADVSANITLAGVNIDVSGTDGACAFKIADNSTGNVTITLADGSENTLTSGMFCAGLQKNGTFISETQGKITIKGGTTGTGKLNANGGMYGAGIGGGDDGSGSNITIIGGVVTANGGMYGAGIGGGDDGSGSNITISGGVITANGDMYGAGIGGGYFSSGSNITISGGFVTASGKRYGAGIGGGGIGSGSNITISGGVVTATGSYCGAGIGGGNNGDGLSINITGGSVKAVTKEIDVNAIGGGYGKDAVTPTNGTTNVYLLTIENPNSEAVTIDGNSYTPVNHKALDSNDGNLYAYLPAKTSTADPLEVKVGTKTTNYIYDTTNSRWLAMVDKPAEDSSTFTYDGRSQTYNIAASDYYTVKDNKQTNAGTYTVTVALTDTTKTVWSDGTTDELNYTFKINKKPATVMPPTAPTAISYGKTLADTGLTEGWTWENKDTVPSPAFTYTAYKGLTDDGNYDYSGLSVSGFTYNEREHTLSYEVPVTVNSVTPVITITADPTSAITGKETTVTVTATAKNPYNDTLSDAPKPKLTYKIGSGEETAITGGSFVIPDTTLNGTEITILAKIDETAKYSQGKDTTTITVSDCTHPNVPTTGDTWERNGTHHWHKCPDCGAELDKAEHSSNAAATETTDEVCKDCEYVMTPALGHLHANHLTFVAEVPETCTTDGVKAHYECDCGKLFDDAAAATETTLSELKIAAHHTYGTEWVSDNDDDHYHVCSVCGDKTDITAHSYDNGVITTPATEQTTGIKTYICSVCRHEKEEILSKLDHEHVLAEDYSCDATGHWHTCSGCTEKVDFESHTEDSGTVTTEATETTDGEITYKCVKCKYTMRTETIPALTADDPDKDMKNFVEHLYTKLLGRASDPKGMANHIQRLKDGQSASDIAKIFVTSSELRNKKLSNTEFVTRMYATMLERVPDAAGLNRWVTALDNGCSYGYVLAGFSTSAEFTNLCKSYGINSGTYTVTENRDKNEKLTAYVSRMYTKALNRTYDINGLNNHTGRYLAGTKDAKGIA
ncbi:MAG: DUF4214 domain-containing protein, partial [Huintestinicola sp.]